jgi:Omp85 superfamily domain
MRTSGDSRTFRIVILLSVMGACCCCCVKLASAGVNRPIGPLSAFDPQTSQDSAEQSPSTPSAEQKPEPKSETEEEKKKKKEKKKSDHAGSFVIAPLPIVSPALGAGFIPIAAYITPIPATDRKVEPSVVGAGGLITNNGSHGFGVGEDIYLMQARYEVSSVYAHGELDYNLYGVGFVNGNAGFKLPLEQSGQVFFFKVLRQIPWKIYVGGRFMTGSSFITLKPTSSTNLPPIPPDVGLHTNLRSLGFEMWRDTRPNRFYPLKGSVIDFTGDIFAKDLGSKYSFQSYKFTFNKYLSLNDKQVLAYNLSWCGTGGSPPFYGNCIYGTNNELRGYTAGRYLDRYMVATQLEYRLVLPWKFGLVGFGGIGSVTPGADQFFRVHQVLPGGGTGIRFMLSKQYHVNLRTDFAWGKDNFTWGVGVGEAF